MTRNITSVGLILATSLLALPSVVAQIADTPQSRMRPIGSPSVVDQYRSSIKRADYHETNARHHQADRPRNNLPVRQTVWMQHRDAPPLLNEGGVALPNQFSPAPNPGASVLLPPPANPQFPPRLNPVPSSDYAPLNQPRLGNQFATLDNSCHVSGPSIYTAASASGCCTPVNYQAPPAYIAPPAPVFVPSVIGVPAPTFAPFAPSVPIAAAPTGVPASPLVSFGQERYQVQVGPGLFGQPVAYVPGQTFRNWVRYVFP